MEALLTPLMNVHKQKHHRKVVPFQAYFRQIPLQFDKSHIIYKQQTSHLQGQ